MIAFFMIMLYMVIIINIFWKQADYGEILSFSPFNIKSTQYQHGITVHFKFDHFLKQCLSEIFPVNLPFNCPFHTVLFRSNSLHCIPHLRKMELCLISLREDNLHKLFGILHRIYICSLQLLIQSFLYMDLWIFILYYGLQFSGKFFLLLLKSWQVWALQSL